MAGLAGLIALVKAWPPVDGLASLAAALGLIGAVVAGGLDLVWRRVPNAVTLGLILAALMIAVARLFVGDWGLAELGAVGLAWLVCLAAWLTRLFGGGDAKLAMGLLALFPTWAAAFLIALGLLVGSAVYLQWGPHPGGWGRVARAAWIGLGRRAPPSRAERDEAYRNRSHPAAPWLAVGFGAFVLWMVSPLAFPL
ncbi:MAG: prepilin peptidase [Anaerolineales bacterium]|nr:prepilin peptidase [Anaerolineales bacterium]